MGLLSSALKTELSKVTPEVYWIATIVTPGGTTVRLSSEPVSSTSLGHCEPWVRQWGQLDRTLSSYRGGLQAVTFSFDVDDTGGQFRSAYGLTLRGGTITLKLVSPNVTAADYLTAFSGKIDAVSRKGARLTIDCRQDDDPLTVPLSKAGITRYAFSNLPDSSDSTSSAAPWIIGSHDSSVLAGAGAVPCLYVDDVGFKYLVGLTWDLNVMLVYSGGTLKTNLTDYTVSQILTGDFRKITVVDFVSTQGTNDVLVDVENTSTSATTPAAALKELLLNLAWNDYHQSTFTLGSEPLSAASFTSLDAFLSTSLGLERAYYLTPERKTGLDILKSFCDSYEVHAYWTYDGKLALTQWEHRTQNDSIYLGPGAPSLSTSLVLTEADQLSEPEIGQDADSVQNRILGKAGLRAADGSYVAQRTVMVDVTGESEKGSEVAMDWLPPTPDSIGSTIYLYPDGDDANTNITQSGAATSWDCLDDDQSLPAGDGGTTRVQSTTASTITEVRCTLTACPSIVTIQSVQLLYTADSIAGTGSDDTIQAYLRIGGVNYNGNVETGMGITWRRINGGVWSLNPATGVAWTQSDLNSIMAPLMAGLYWDPGTTVGKKIRYTQMFVKVNCSTATGSPPPTVNVLSRRANRYRRAPMTFACDAPLKFIDLELGSDLPVERRDMGWTADVWSRRLHRVRGLRVMPGQKRVRLDLEDVQPQLSTFWCWGPSLVGVDGGAVGGDGMALLTHGGDVTTTRGSVKNVDAPAGIGVQSAGPVVQIQSNALPSERHGMLLERAMTNELKRSSFVSGTTGLTISAGSGSAAASTTLADQLFADSTVTANVLLLTAGSPHATETRVTWPTFTVSPGDVITISIDRKGSSTTAGDGLSWRMTRASDGYYYNDSGSGAWQAGAADNALSETTSWARAVSNDLLPYNGKGSDTLTFSVSLPSGGTASRTVHVGHVQIEKSRWASSRIVTDAATATRSADNWSIENDQSDGSTTYYTLPNTRGTFVCKWQPLFTEADLAASQKHYLYRLSYDASNRLALWYEQGVGHKLEVVAGGSTYTATVASPTATRGTSMDVAVRWGSSVAELDETAGTATLLVRDSSGTVTSGSVAFGTAPTFAAAKSFEIGYDAGTSGRELDGYLIEARISPFVWSDDEIWGLLS